MIQLACSIPSLPLRVLTRPHAVRRAIPCSGCWTVVGLAGPAPWQTPQSARREDGGEESEHADRDQRPDEKEVSAGIGEPAGDADTLPLHVDDGDDQRKERPEEHDDVPRSPFEEHERSVMQDDGDEHPAHQV